MYFKQTKLIYVVIFVEFTEKCTYLYRMKAIDALSQLGKFVVGIPLLDAT